MTKNIPTPITILWHATTRGKKLGIYKFCQTLSNTEHGGDSKSKFGTVNAAAIAVSPNTNYYTTDEYIRYPGVPS